MTIPLAILPALPYMIAIFMRFLMITRFMDVLLPCIMAHLATHAFSFVTIIRTFWWPVIEPIAAPIMVGLAQIIGVTLNLLIGNEILVSQIMNGPYVLAGIATLAGGITGFVVGVPLAVILVLICGMIKNMIRCISEWFAAKSNNWALLTRVREHENEMKYKMALQLQSKRCVAELSKFSHFRQLIGSDAVGVMLDRNEDSHTIYKALNTYEQESMSRIRLDMNNWSSWIMQFQGIDVSRETMNIYSHVTSYLNNRSDFGGKGLRVVYDGNADIGEFRIFKTEVVKQDPERYQLIKLIEIYHSGNECNKIKYIFAEFMLSGAIDELECEISDFDGLYVNFADITWVLGEAFGSRCVSDLDIEHPYPYEDSVEFDPEYELSDKSVDDTRVIASD